MRCDLCGSTPVMALIEADCAVCARCLAAHQELMATLPEAVPALEALLAMSIVELRRERRKETP